MQRKDWGYNGQRMMKMELAERRKTSPQRGFMDVVEEDMQNVGEVFC